MLALRGDPPQGETEFEPEGGLASAAELAALHRRRYDFALGGACFPEVHPEAAEPQADLAYLKTKVDAGARFLITQLFFDNSVYFDFVAAARESGDRRADHPRGHPDRQLRPGRADLQALRRRRSPSRSPSAMEALGGDGEAEAVLGVAYAARQCEELLAGGAPGIHFYALNRAPGYARRALRPARVAAVGARGGDAPAALGRRG